MCKFDVLHDGNLMSALYHSTSTPVSMIDHSTSTPVRVDRCQIGIDLNSNLPKNSIRVNSYCRPHHSNFFFFEFGLALPPFEFLFSEFLRFAPHSNCRHSSCWVLLQQFEFEFEFALIRIKNRIFNKFGF